MFDFLAQTLLMDYIVNEMQHSNRHHTVPQSFLKNFSEDGNNIYRKHKRVDDDDRVNKELNRSIPIKSATVSDNFYTVNSGREPMLIEKLIYANEIENYYPHYYDILTNPDIEGLRSLEDRSRLLMCLLSLHCRTPKQFKYFLDTVPKENDHEIKQIREDYKGAHVLHTMTSFIDAHQYKAIRIVRITDSSEFITSDNPVLLINTKGDLLNHRFREQFNIDNTILIPLDRKHCCILVNATDKNGTSIYGRLFYNRIERIDVDCSFTQNVNYRMLGSADKYYYGSKKYLNAFFTLYKLV